MPFFTEARSGKFLVFSLTGRIEGTRVSEFSEQLMRQIDSGENHIVLDCSAVSCLASPARRVLLAVARRLESRGGLFKVAGLRSTLRGPIAELRGPVGPLPLYASLGEALNCA